MILNDKPKGPVLIAGNGKLLYSVAACLLQNEYRVTLCTSDKEESFQSIGRHFTDIKKNTGVEIDKNLLEITSYLTGGPLYRKAILITDEDIELKKDWIRKLESVVEATCAIAVNSESFLLSRLQEECSNPIRVMGVNWAEPAHTTYFLEVIANKATSKTLAESFAKEAKHNWGKDPYIIYDDIGVRAKMMAAMTREAFYLIENGFASREDIDRACRNDPGYYLPFAGNFRYIDLMGGAMAYGRVMKDLNPELSTSSEVPEFFIDSVDKSKSITKNNNDESEKRNQDFRDFSYQIQEIIKKYPFYFPDNYHEKKDEI